MWNKSIDTRKKGTLVISNNPEALTWFESNFPSALIINTETVADEQLLFSQDFGILIYDIDMDGGLKFADTIFQRYPYASKIAFSRGYQSKVALDLFRKGTTHFVLFPIKKEDFEKVLYSENHFASEYQKIESLMSILLKSDESCQNDFNALFADTVEDKERSSIFEAKASLTRLLISTKEKHGELVSGEELMAIFPIKLIEFASNRSHIKTALDSIVGEHIYPQLVKANPTILIVEDERVFRESLSGYLDRFTQNVITAESSSEAMEKIQNLETLDIKILDIDLPGEKGVDLLPKINEKFPDSQTIMVTAYDDMSYVTKSYSHNVFDYIVKPVELQILVNKISRAIQIKGLKRILHSLGQALFPKIPQKDRLSVMNQIVHHQLKGGVPVLMEDVLFLFPECVPSGLSKEQEIPREILEDGVGLLINAILYQLKRGESCEVIFDDWRSFVSNLS